LQAGSLAVLRNKNTVVTATLRPKEVYHMKSSVNYPGFGQEAGEIIKCGQHSTELLGYTLLGPCSGGA
jgi:hypothetical protein